jgi:hypothetical protein
MPVPDLETIEYKLKKRGFKQVDVYHHECPACQQKAVRIYGIASRIGGRDIRLCLACGDARSYRAIGGMEASELDASFDLRAFLG